MSDDTNDGQRTFWNEGPGQAWVAHQAELDALHASVTDLLIAEARPAPGQRVLDIGCGAGASSIAFAERVGSDGSVTGLDFSEPLLALARRRAERAGLDNLAFTQADAQNADFTDAGYDLAVSRFGLMFFSDPVAAFRNIARALRPNAAMVFASWAAAEENPWFDLPMQLAVERLGAAPPSPPDAPGPTAFRDIDRVTGLLSQAGWQDAKGHRHGVDLHLAGGPVAAAALACKIGPVSRHLRDKGGTEEDRAAIHARLLERMEPFTSDDGIRVPATVIVYSAKAPA